MSDDRIDILQEFVDAASQEELLAVCEFTIPRAGTAGVTGLCRVSKPRGHGTGLLNYLSLVFVADAPDDAARGAVDELLDGLDDPEFRTALPMIQEVMPVPSMATAGESYVRQVDLLFGERVDPGVLFLRERFLPTLQRHLPLRVGEVLWWGTPDAAPAPTPPPAPSRSLLDGLKRYFTRRAAH